MPGELHEAIVERAIKFHGWQRGSWRMAFKEKCKERPEWASELKIEDDGRELWGNFGNNPDAWRIVVETPDTPDMDWGQDILVVEMLEVEIGFPMSLFKRRNYTGLWMAFDNTSNFHLRVYRTERHGPIVRWLDFDTISSEMELHIRQAERASRLADSGTRL